MDMRLSEVDTTDQISIRTRFSDYSFRVTDPSSCSGVLSGGTLGNQLLDACLIGTVFPGSEHTTYWRKELETGGHAVFLILGESVKRLTTSVIIEITVLSTNEPTNTNQIAA